MKTLGQEEAELSTVYLINMYCFRNHKNTCANVELNNISSYKGLLPSVSIGMLPMESRQHRHKDSLSNNF